jgi:hypothetical protein
MTLSHLTVPFEGLLATPSSRLPYQHNVLLRSYVLQRPAGNMVVYNSPGIDAAAADIAKLGAPSRLLINHAHEAMYGTPELGMPIWAHRDDRAEIGNSLAVSGQFDSRQMIDDDLEVIPTPGHTAGTTSYLWDNGEHRFLFTGDFIWIEDGEWKAVVLDPTLRHAYLRSLAIVRDLDFDVLVPWGVTEGDHPVDLVSDPADKVNRIQRIIDRLSVGESR